MSSENNKGFEPDHRIPDFPKRSIAEKLAVASRLRDLQRSLAPIRAANQAKRASGKVEIRIKTK
jgi:hypothetical protein